MMKFDEKALCFLLVCGKMGKEKEEKEERKWETEK